MLKVKKGKNSHRSRTVDEAIKDVKKVEEGQISFYLPKEVRKKFKRKAEDEGSNMQDVLVRYIKAYIED
jgi:hypothetical protein